MLSGDQFRLDAVNPALSLATVLLLVAEDVLVLRLLALKLVLLADTSVAARQPCLSREATCNAIWAVFALPDPPTRFSMRRKPRWVYCATS